jgi:hypothetical protein
LMRAHIILCIIYNKNLPAQSHRTDEAHESDHDNLTGS